VNLAFRGTLLEKRTDRLVGVLVFVTLLWAFLQAL
jgi:hypothetical protein